MTALNKTIFSLVASTLVFLVMTTAVLADGQYGGGAETPTEQPKEEVTHLTHETKPAGIGDNLVVLGLIAGSAGLVLALLSRFTKRMYFLD